MPERSKDFESTSDNASTMQSNSALEPKEPAGEVATAESPQTSEADHVVENPSVDVMTAEGNEEEMKSEFIGVSRPVVADREEDEGWEVVGGAEDVEDWALVHSL